MGTRSRQRSKGSVEYEKRAARLVLPPHVLRRQVEEFAERVRDGVNSQLGRDRLGIRLLRDNGDDSVDVLFSDTDGPDGWDVLYVGWEQGVDTDATIGMLLSGAYEAQNREEALNADD